MATYYSQKSGSATDTTVWNTAAGGGGSAPASFAAMDNNAIEIQAGHDVEWDGDTSGWANGIQGIMIRGGVSPGMLHAKYSASGTFYIKIISGYTIQGSTVTNRGRILANSDGVWGNTGSLPFDRKFTMEFLGAAGTAKIDASNLDIQLYCTQPLSLSVRTYGTLYKTDDGTPLSVDYTTDTFTRNTHGWANATPVMFESTGNLPSPLLRDTLYWVISSATNTFKVAYYSAGVIVNLTDNGTGTISVYSGPSNSTTLNVLDDVSGDTAWVTTVGHNRVVLASAGPENYNQLRTTLSTINSTTIVLAANGLSNLRPNTRIWLMSRNILIKYNVGPPDQNLAVVDWGVSSTFTGSVLQCEFWSASGNGTTFYGRATLYGYGHTISGTASGFTHAIYHCNNFTISAVIAGSSSAVYSTIATQASTISGKIAGCSVGLNAVVLANFTGEIYGCSTGLYNCSGATCSGTLRGCNTGYDRSGGNVISGYLFNCGVGVSGCNNVMLTSASIIYGTGAYGIQNGMGVFNGTIIGNSYGMIYPAGLIVSGSIFYCATGVFSASSAYCTMTLRGAQFYSNTTDLLYGSASAMMVDGYASGLRSTTQVSGYKHSANYSTDSPLRTQIIDLCDANGITQPGYVGCWCPGGYTKTAVYALGTHGTPPTTLAAIHESIFEDSDRDVWVEFPVMGKKNCPVSVIVYHAVTSTTGWVTAPLIEICDPSKGWKLANEVLASSSSFTTADTNWHTDQVTYKPTYDRPLTIRVRGCGGNAGGTGTGKMYWWQIIDVGTISTPMIGGKNIRRL